MYLALKDIKKHLNIDLDFVEDDKYLLDLASVAEVVVERAIDHPLSHFVDANGLLDAPLLHCMLLLIGTYYANRESETAAYSTNPLGHAFDYIVAQYKDYTILPIETR